MKVVGNCGNEKVVKALQELIKEFLLHNSDVSKVYLAFDDGMFSVGELEYGSCSSVEEIIDKVNSNKENIVEDWNSMKEEFPEANGSGYWFLSDDVADCYINGTGILTSEDEVSMRDVLQGKVTYLKQLLSLVELGEEAYGYYCYDGETDTLYNHSDYSDMIGEQVAKACGIEL